MATIVVHKASNTRFILVGSGYGMAETAFSESMNSRALLALCSADGEIGWYRSSDCRVVEIDGKPPHQYVGDDSRQL